MAMHNALTTHDLEALFAAAEGDGQLLAVAKPVLVTVQVGGQTYDDVGRDGLERLKACGYVEGGPEVYQITQAGREYAESMN